MNAMLPFHPGELEAQHRAGVSLVGAPIRDFMPDRHREFFSLLPFLLLGATGTDGWTWATALHGAPGFVASPDPQTLRIAAPPDQADPLALAPGTEIGLLGIDLATRRRNRANGVITAIDPSGLTVAVRESFGNCPKYIVQRQWEPAPSAPHAPEHLTGLDPVARQLITQADTFFVASARGPGAPADISHRGGPPGFVRLDGDVLTIPDFHGNRYFNTLGNLLLHPPAGLLFIDFTTGDLLHLAGEAATDWHATERVWRVHVRSALRRNAALPLRWRPIPACPPAPGDHIGAVPGGSAQ